MVVVGHQKGRDTKDNVARNFGMAFPGGYRKALRLMKHADKFGMPILTFIDTPGAWSGVEAEKLGQGEAIAYNLRANVCVGSTNYLHRNWGRGFWRRIGHWCGRPPLDVGTLCLYRS